MSQIWLTSDTHFCHDRDFVWGARGFKNVDEMNKEIVKRWNSVVEKDDIVYHLGDVMLGDNQRGLYYLKQLKGTIYIALGNHDTSSRAELYKECYNIKDVQLAYRIKSGKKTLILTHYPTIVTNFSEEHGLKTICLCGHSHTNNKFQDLQYGCYHVEMDAHNCTPITLEKILLDLQGQRCPI